MAEATINGESIYLVTPGLDASGGIVVDKCSSTATLGAGVTFTGVGTDCEKYTQITVSILADEAGTLYIEQSPDNFHWDQSESYAVAANVSEAHRVLVVARYFRTRYVNGAAENHVFRLQAMLHEWGGTQPAGSSIDAGEDFDAVKAIITGKQIGGAYADAGLTVEGFIKTYAAGPAAAYGELITSENNPIAQATFVIGTLFPDVFVQDVSGTGSISVANSVVSVSTGATANSYAFLSTRRLLKERPGQGKLGRFSAIFTSPVANSQQLAGIFTASNGFAFGYFGTAFGIHHLYGGITEIRTLTITTASTTAENVTVTLNGTAYTVAVTNSASKAVTANEISRGTFGPWTAYQMAPTVGDPYVVFVGRSPGARAGAYGLTATSAVGTFAQVAAGSSPSYEFVAQASWNIDPLTGSGPSGMTLVPTKGNVYSIDSQFLGFGAINFYVEEPTTGRLIVVHRIQYANDHTRPNVDNPSMPISLLSISIGSTTDLTIKSASMAGYTQGPVRYLGPKRSVTGAVSGIGASYQPIISIRNPQIFGTRVNMSEILIRYLSMSCEGSKPVDFVLVLNPATMTTPQWKNVNVAQSILQTDTAATAYTGGIEEFAVTMSKSGFQTIDLEDLELYLRSGDVMMIAARSASSSDVTATISVVEDI